MKKVFLTSILAAAVFLIGSVALADAPATPVNILATPASPTTINLSWDASAGAVGYEIFRNSTTTPIATTSATSYINSGLTPVTLYTYYLIAYDASNTKSALSTGVATTTLADSAIPTAPTNLIATSISASQINLAWTAATDDVAVTGYRVFRNGVQIATTTHTYYTDLGLAAATSYTYNLSAFDAAGNISAASAELTVFTLATGQVATSTVSIQIINGDKRGKLINYRSNEIIYLAVFSDANFSARTIKNNTVLFGGAQAISWRLKDVNKDGRMDRIYGFRARNLEKLNAEENILVFSATTKDGKQIHATAIVRVKNGPNKYKEMIQKRIQELQRKIEKLENRLENFDNPANNQSGENQDENHGKNKGKK